MSSIAKLELTSENSTFSVVIATSGRVQKLGKTLASLLRCRIPQQLVYIHVVENGPSQGVEELMLKSTNWRHKREETTKRNT